MRATYVTAMQHLKTHYHPDITSLEGKSIIKRLTTRSIAMQGDYILLMYTARYEDYSLPGGGLNEAEDIITGMMRELREETGAMGITNITPYGTYEEYRPWYKPTHDIQHITSYCYTCEVHKELGTASLERYEASNGMKAVWIPIQEAIAHNEHTIATSSKKGMSIERETFLLKHIANTL